MSIFLKNIRKRYKVSGSYSRYRFKINGFVNDFREEWL